MDIGSWLSSASQQLRRRGLIELANRRLTIMYRPGLEEIAEFDPSYLYLNEQQL